MLRLAHQWSFLCCFDCILAVFDCFWYSLGRPVTIDTPMVIFFCFDRLLTVFDCFFTIGTPLVHCWYSLGRPVTIGTPMVSSVFDDWYSVPFVKNSQKQSKDSQTAKMAIGVPIVTCLHRVRRIHKVRVRVRRMHKAVCVYRYSCPNLYHRNSLFVYV